MGAGIQSSDGVAASTILYSTTNPPQMNARIDKQDVPASGHIADAKNVKNTKKYSEPSVSGAVNNEFFGLLLKAALGTLTTTADTPETDVHSHAALVANTNAHPKLTLVFDEGALAGRQIVDAMISRLQFTVKNGEVASFEADFMGGFPTDVSLSPVVPDEINYDPSHVTVKVEANEGALAGGTGKCVEEVTLTIEKNIGSKYCLGSITPDKLFNTEMVITGSMISTYEDQTYRDVWKDSSFKAIGIYLVNDDELIGAATDPSLEFIIPKAAYKEWTMDAPTDDLVRQTIAFKAYLSGSDFIKANIVNTTETY